MRPDREEALVEDFRVRVGAVIGDVYATIADIAKTEEEVDRLHRRLIRSVILLAALMHADGFGEREDQGFLELASCARRVAGVAIETE